MRCKVIIQQLDNHGDVYIPDKFNGYQHIENGKLYLIEFKWNEDGTPYQKQG